MLGVVVMINKRKDCDSHPAFTSMDEKVRNGTSGWEFLLRYVSIPAWKKCLLNFIIQVISNHMDVLGMVLENIQLYESSRQEAKRSQVATWHLLCVDKINPSMCMHTVYLCVC